MKVGVFRGEPPMCFTGIFLCLFGLIVGGLQGQVRVQDSLHQQLEKKLPPEARIYVLKQLSDSYFYPDVKLDTAEAYLEKAIAVARLHGLNDSLAFLQLKISSLRDYKGEIVQAYPDLVEGYSYFKAEGYIKEAAAMQVLLGVYYESQGISTQALNYYMEALHTFKGLGEEQLIANTYANLAILYEHSHDYAKTLDYRIKTRRISEGLKDTFQLASDIHNIAHTYGLMNQDSLAFITYEEAREMAQVSKDTLLVAHISSGKGDLESRKDQHEVALDLHLKAFRIFQGAGDILNMGRESIAISESCLKLGKMTEAEQWANESLEYVSAANQLDLKVRSYSLLTEIALSRGDYQEAFAAQAYWIQLRDSLSSYKKRQELTAASQSFSFQQQASENRMLRMQRYSLLIGLGLLLAITTLLFLLNRQRKRYNETLEKTVEERTELLRKKHGELKKMHAEVEHFVYIISHDLKQPIATISGYVGMLSKKYGQQLDEKGRSYLNYIKNSTAWSKRLLDELLNYSRIGRGGEVSEIDSGEMIRDILNDFQQEIIQTKAFIQLEGDFPTLKGVHSDYHLVFEHIIANALKFRRKEVPLSINLRVEDKGTEWEFAIEDNGIGIQEEYIDRIFTIFQRLHHKDEYAGTGYGLAACKKIMEVYGGTIRVESTYQKGSTFFVDFPKELIFDPPPVPKRATVPA